MKHETMIEWKKETIQWYIRIGYGKKIWHAHALGQYKEHVH